MSIYKFITTFLFLVANSVIQAQNFEWENFKNKQFVFVFLSPDCPLSQKYTLTLKNIQKQFQQADIGFYAVFPGNLYTELEIGAFENRYQLGFNSIHDINFELTKKLDASITPEVFVLDEHLQTVYSGAIDNWYVSVSKKRGVISEHYLQDALAALRAAKEIKIKKTQAVGCLIERR
jgi:glutathione peroxidase-family protein